MWEVTSHSRAQLFANPWTVVYKAPLCPWNFPGKSTGVGCHFLLQGIFPTQGSNPGLPHCRRHFTVWATREAHPPLWMWELDHKEGWTPKHWCFWTVVLEKTLECPLNCKEMKLVNPKENQSWIFIGRTDAEAEAPILWASDAKCWLIRKDPDAGKDWGQEEKGTTEYEMVRWHHWLNGHESEGAPGVADGQGGGDGQGGLVSCCPWGHSQTRLSG